MEEVINENLKTNTYYPENLGTQKDVLPEAETPQDKKTKKNRKQIALLNYANQKLEEIESRIGMQLSGFSELYDNMTQEEQETFLRMMKEAEKEQYDNEKPKHPNTRKKKRPAKVKHGPRKKK